MYCVVHISVVHLAGSRPPCKLTSLILIQRRTNLTSLLSMLNPITSDRGRGSVGTASSTRAMETINEESTDIEELEKHRLPLHHHQHCAEVLQKDSNADSSETPDLKYDGRILFLRSSRTACL